MIVIPADDVHGRYGNIYDQEKLQSVVDMIQDSDNPVEFTCPYGFGTVVDFGDIREHQEAKAAGRFYEDYDGFEQPYTTGYSDIDQYIGSEDYISDEYSLLSDEVIQYMEDNKFSIIEGNKTEEQLRQGFQELDIEHEEEESYFDEFVDIELDLKEAQDSGDGDFGKFRVQLRDGHHRIMGAVKAGEAEVCVELGDKGIDNPLFKGKFKKVGDQ